MATTTLSEQDIDGNIEGSNHSLRQHDEHLLVDSRQGLRLSGTTSRKLAAYPAFYKNGFEEEADVDAGSFPDDAMHEASRLGTLASDAVHGDFYGILEVNAFTRYGGYNSVFPEGGYQTSIDIFLNSEDSVGEDYRIDWSSAINHVTGVHRRDYIFHVGTDVNNHGGFVVSATNNSPGQPDKPSENPVYLAEGGWYTFQHSFDQDANGTLLANMNLFDATGELLGTWARLTVDDIIGVTVGGNRYGWLVTNTFPTPITADNVIRTGRVPADKEQCKNHGWQQAFRADGSSFKNQGRCIKYVKTGK
eukprot:CAMPEP_0119019292 /NCGR_PEP_ID=MMETSP1176-20130426/21448_1 /TAXON_ID=265551 /ORGANISM="Synedropsis recta cf, Strain CCMP1620" /LENGTH=304 /DNA_ID=CAMNT_0006973457 /DNA_START=365 /DNA_END=1279 /DNA_ORIENTATION=+